MTPGVSTRGNFLWGGCGLGAAIEAMEGTTGRPVVWATAQYLSYANPPSIMDIDVVVANAGRSVTQARAVGHVGDREILTVNAALGQPRRRRGRRLGDDARRAAARGVRAALRGRRRRGDDVPPRLPARRRPQLGRHRRSPVTRRQLLDVGPHARRARDVGRGPGHPRGLRPVRPRPGPGAPRRRQQPRQHPAHGRDRPDRLGVARHPCPRHQQRLRSRPRPPLGRGRHVVGDRQPVDDPALPRGVRGAPPSPAGPGDVRVVGTARAERRLRLEQVGTEVHLRLVGEHDRRQHLVGDGLALGVPEREQEADVADDGVDEVGEVADDAHAAADQLAGVGVDRLEAHQSLAGMAAGLTVEVVQVEADADGGEPADEREQRRRARRRPRPRMALMMKITM